MSADWATDLAITIIADVHRSSYTDAVGVITERLRLVRVQGMCHSLDEALHSFGGSLREPPPATPVPEAAE